MHSDKLWKALVRLQQCHLVNCILYPIIYPVTMITCQSTTLLQVKLKSCNWATIHWPALLYWIRSIVTYGKGNE